MTPGKIDSREKCAAADLADPLADFRNEFDIPKGVFYFDGNSLGAKPRGVERLANLVVCEEWGRGLIRSWNNSDWFEMPSRLGDKIGRLIGAGPREVLVTDTTSLNLFKVIASSIAIQQIDHPDRKVIVVERDNFPSDVYIAEGLVEFLNAGYSLRYVDETLTPEEAIKNDTVLIALSHVNYRTGKQFDMASISTHAHDHGAHAIWDLAHSAGSVPVNVNIAGADFAVGCTYKYLNGGPGSPAFVWMHPRHYNRVWQPLSGWWGHSRPFGMEGAYEANEGILRFKCGTQPIVSMSLLECGLDIALRADLQMLRMKSLELTDLFIFLVEKRCSEFPLTLITPRDHERRGSHVSFQHPQGYQVMQALISRGVIGDYREPEVLRFGITPLYLSYVDVWDAVEILRDVLETKAWKKPEFRMRSTVT